VINYKEYKKVYVLESNTLGVQVNEAETLLKSYRETSRAVGVRRLLRPADSSFAALLSDFAEKNLGKGYNFNLIQMLGGMKMSTSVGGPAADSGDDRINSLLF
jgi:hypothetical protein